MSNRRIVCPSCNTIFSESLLKQKGSEDRCLVCGASLSMDEPESAPEEELVDWYYYSTGRGHYLSDEPLDGYRLEYKFKAPQDLENAKEVLRKEYDPTAFATPSINTKPDPVVRCPRCGSTSIQLIPKKWSPLTGFRTNSVIRCCVNCKHRW